jgi:hypothetical protein
METKSRQLAWEKVQLEWATVDVLVTEWEGVLVTQSG